MGEAAIFASRLSLIDSSTGHQPITSEDDTTVLACNGEIYNHEELRNGLRKKGHRFKTKTDVEVILHLYEEYGVGFLNMLNGQFAFAIYDTRRRRLLLARDPMGICPLFYTKVPHRVIFASEIKAIVQHPLVVRQVDVIGIDQMLAFPGLVSPRTMFQGIASLPAGHYAEVYGGNIHVREYWDMEYPEIESIAYDKPDSYYAETLCAHIERAVSRRLAADVPVGVCLSGGLDSSLIAVIAGSAMSDSPLKSYAVRFPGLPMCESKHRTVLTQCRSENHMEVDVDCETILNRLFEAVYYSECPLKETYNVASLELAEKVHRSGIKAVLMGEGADELFGGYPGYRFDTIRDRGVPRLGSEVRNRLEADLRQKVWGVESMLYESHLLESRASRRALYSQELASVLQEEDAYDVGVIRKERLQNRHMVHQRSYLDIKLRLCDHLVSDHGDRMCMANSVEARYPFLDKDMLEFVKEIPPYLMVNDRYEKYVLRKAGEAMLPKGVCWRPKYAFHAPGSHMLLQKKEGAFDEFLSYEAIKAQGYFDPDVVRELARRQACRPDALSIPNETDVMMFVITFGMFLKAFNMPPLG